MPSNPGAPTSREGNAAQNLALGRQMRDVSLHLVDIKNTILSLMESNKAAIGEVADKVFSPHTMAQGELVTLNKEVGSLKVAIQEIPKAINSEQARSVTADGDQEKSLVVGCLAFCRLTVGLALLGKGYPLDVFARPNQPDDMEEECAKLVLGNDATPDDVQQLLNLHTTADRSGITTIVRQTEGSASSSSKQKTVRERISLQRRRVHDTVAPKIVNAWMSCAPGFASYRFGVAVKDQPSEVLNAAKDACKKEDGNRPAYLDASKFGNSFHEACKELMRTTSQIVAQALQELSRIVPPDALQDVRESVKAIEEGHGYDRRGMHEFSEVDGFLPQQLAFVIVKISSKLSDLVLAGQGRVKRGIELGHYHQWLKECVEISRLVDRSHTRQVRRDETEAFKEVDEMMVNGVPIRGVLPDYEYRLMDYLLTGDTSFDLGPERFRRRVNIIDDENSGEQGASSGEPRVLTQIAETPRGDEVIPESSPMV